MKLFIREKRITSISKKDLQSNQEGSISSLALMLILLISALSLTCISKSLEELNYIRFRNKSYLCAKSLISEVRPYAKFMKNLNKVIQIAHPLQFVPIPKVRKIATTVVKTSIFIQNAYHAAYILKVLTNKKCTKLTRLSFIKSIPAHTKNFVILKRKKNKTVEMRKKWKTTMIFKAGEPLEILKHSFAINLVFQKHSSKGGMLEITSQEINTVALQKLRLLVGQ
jgi:hypothetical protein